MYSTDESMLRRVCSYIERGCDVSEGAVLVLAPVERALLVHQEQLVQRRALQPRET